MRLKAPTFAGAVFPDRWKVGRVLLEPHTLGHALLLQRLGNPYAQAVSQAVPQLGALVLASFVCSRPASIAARTAGGWWAKQWMVYHAIVWGSTHAEREAELRLYLAAAWHTPAFKPTSRPTGSHSAGADPLHVLWLHRRMHLGETEDEAMRCPLLRARMDHLAWAEQQGAIVILGDDLTPTEKLLEAAEANAEWDRQLRKADRG